VSKLRDVGESPERRSTCSCCCQVLGTAYGEITSRSISNVSVRPDLSPINACRTTSSYVRARVSVTNM
jgi:hypothetical protein